MTFIKSNGETHYSLLEAYKDNIKDIITSMISKIKKGSNKHYTHDNYGDYDDIIDNYDNINDDDEVEVIINEEDNENGI